MGHLTNIQHIYTELAGVSGVGPGRANEKKNLKWISKKILSLYYPSGIHRFHKIFQPIRSSRLAANSLHIYVIEELCYIDNMNHTMTVY